MSSPVSSPERHSVKVTYLDRTKKKAKNTSDKASDEEQDAASETASVGTKQYVKKPLGSMNPPQNPAPRKVDYSRPPVSQGASVAGSTKKGKSSHIRSKSSAASLSERSTKHDKDAPAFTASKVLSMQRIAASDADMDDTTSVAESFSGTGKSVRRTEAERLEYFKNQPECNPDSIQPNSVKCLRCHKEVKLGGKTSYAVRPWEKHRASCDQKVPKSLFSDDKTEARTEVSVPSSPRKNLSERKAALEADPGIVEVKESEVKCRRCEKWIRLSKTTPYSASNWKNHKHSCGETIPSDRVAVAGRLLKVVNDSDVKSYGPQHVVCKHCGVDVILEGEGEYNLSKWELHKSSCPSMPRTALHNRHTAALSTASGSTDVTLVDGSPKRGTKRSRDETDLEVEESRASNRPRTEKYQSVEQPTSTFGWLLTPFRAFMSGLQDSLKTEGAA